MKKTLSIILCGLVLAGCSKEELSQEANNFLFSNPGDIFISVDDVMMEGTTKTAASLDEAKGLSFKWSEGDKVGVYSGEGGMALFNIQSGEGMSSAFFHGDGFSLKPGNTFYALYPYNGLATTSTGIPLDYSTRKISGQNKLEDIIPYDFLSASAVADDESHAVFNFKHLSSFGRLKLSLPTEETINSIDIIPTYGTLTDALTYNIKTGSTTISSQKVVKNIPVENVIGKQMTAWLAFAPQELDDAAVVIKTASGKTYTTRLAGKAMQAGKSYRWEAEAPALPTAPAASLCLTTLFKNAISNAPAGDYSGITHIKGDRYAVVHDGMTGGGIVFFDMAFKSDGSLSAFSHEIPEGTSEAKNNRDAEGIVYVPSRNTLFVSGERDQKILEYDLNGRPTGKGLKIPEDMSTSSISGNNGFEALAYNANTGLFWTTTENVLMKDQDYRVDSRSFIRLQSFRDDTLDPEKRYLYMLDTPQYGPGANITYAFGVPDILAMDDGTLVIMEREAYVPTSSALSIMQSVTRVKFYLVDPVNDKGGILSKTLLHTIDTSFLGWANYEGICLGPVLPNGTETILVINDSQSNYKGYLSDYLTVLKYQPL